MERSISDIINYTQEYVLGEFTTIVKNQEKLKHNKTTSFNCKVNGLSYYIPKFLVILKNLSVDQLERINRRLIEVNSRYVGILEEDDKNVYFLDDISYVDIVDSAVVVGEDNSLPVTRKITLNPNIEYGFSPNVHISIWKKEKFYDKNGLYNAIENIQDNLDNLIKKYNVKTKLSKDELLVKLLELNLEDRRPFLYEDDSILLKVKPLKRHIKKSKRDELLRLCLLINNEISEYVTHEYEEIDFYEKSKEDKDNVEANSMLRRMSNESYRRIRSNFQTGRTLAWPPYTNEIFSMLPNHELKRYLFIFIDYHTSSQYYSLSHYVKLLCKGLDLSLTDVKYSNKLLKFKLKRTSDSKLSRVYGDLINIDSDKIYNEVKMNVINDFYNQDRNNFCSSSSSSSTESSTEEEDSDDY